MRRRLDASTLVPEPATAVRTRFVDSPGSWLPPPARPAGPSRWLVDLHAGLVTHPAVCTVGAPWHRDGLCWRRLRWEPADDEDRARTRTRLPRLEGELGLDTSRVPARLVLRAGYVPPGGVLGGTADLLALRLVARLTARRFLADVAARLATVDDAPSTATGDDPRARDGRPGRPRPRPGAPPPASTGSPRRSS